MISAHLTLPVSHAVHIGAGTGAGAAACCRAGLDPVVLVEADPGAMAPLRRLAARWPAVQAVQAAVCARPGPQRYHRTNFGDLNSLLPPGPGLRALFPGLQVLAREPLETLPPEELIAGLELPGDGAGLLVIEAPGEAASILDALAGAGLLEGFQVIRVQEGAVPLYDGAAGIADLRAQLAGLGYAAWPEADPEDPDRPYLLAARSAVQGEMRKTVEELAAALRDSEESRGLLQQERGDLAARLGQLQAQSAAAVAEHGAALEAAAQRGVQMQEKLEALEAENSRLAAKLGDSEKDRGELQQEHGAALEAAAQRGAQMQEKLEALEAENSRLAAKLGDSEKDRGELQQEHRAALEAAAQREAQMQEKLENLETENSRLASELDTAAEAAAVQQDLSVSLRMQALREADLRELQARYGALLQQKEEQDSLLQRLGAGLKGLLEAERDGTAADGKGSPV